MLHKFIIGVLTLLLFSGTALAKQWRGIEPYHSTRADVDRLLGPPNFNGSSYDFADERAHITYSDGACNVTRDVVIKISTYPAKFVPIATVLSADKNYEQIQCAHTSAIDYFDQVDGITYHVQEGMVISITYGAAAKDRMLICGENRYAAPVPAGTKLSSVEHYPFDSFGNIAFENVEARLDNFSFQLSNLKKQDERWRGYILVYAGHRAYRGEAYFKAACFSDYLIRVRGVDPASLTAVDGGFRKEMTTELFLGRSDVYPPVLTPTVSLKNVQIINRDLRDCRAPGP